MVETELTFFEVQAERRAVEATELRQAHDRPVLEIGRLLQNTRAEPLQSDVLVSLA